LRPNPFFLSYSRTVTIDRRRVDFSVEETSREVKPALPVDIFAVFCLPEGKNSVFWTDVSIRLWLLFFNREA
jgi:hypothetical protein